MSPKARDLVNNHAQAVVSDSWKGNTDPADYDEVEERLEKTFKALDNYITELEAKRGS